MLPSLPLQQNLKTWFEDLLQTKLQSSARSKLPPDPLCFAAWCWLEPAHSSLCSLHRPTSGLFQYKENPGKQNTSSAPFGSSQECLYGTLLERLRGKRLFCLSGVGCHASALTTLLLPECCFKLRRSIRVQLLANAPGRQGWEPQVLRPSHLHWVGGILGFCHQPVLVLALVSILGSKKTDGRSPSFFEIHLKF